MKKILGLLLIACQISMAQSLSGTIKYDVKFDMPEKNKQEMQKYGIAMPTGMELTTNGTNAKMKMTSSAGTMMEVIHTTKESFFLDSKNKKAYKLPENMASQGPKATVTKTEEFETIASHKCRKYVVDKGGAKEFIWATPDYKISPAMLASFSRRPGDNSYIKEIDGIPLKMITNEHGNNMEMTAVSITDSKPSEKDLSVPADYTVEPFNPAVMGMMMGAGGPPKRN
jgi:hypothetical protein